MGKQLVDFITLILTTEKAELNEKLRHFYAEAKPKIIEKRAKSMLDEHAQVYHKKYIDKFSGRSE
jgi:hypothetical protein